jgi:hypothetical protein
MLEVIFYYETRFFPFVKCVHNNQKLLLSTKDKFEIMKPNPSHSEYALIIVSKRASLNA